LFPVGWCESNGYQLKVPVAINGKKKTAVVLPEYEIKLALKNGKH
jgi:hypothetical protein